MSDHVISDESIWKAFITASKGAAALIVATGVLWGAIWWALQPRIDQYFSDKLNELRAEFLDVSAQLNRIENALPAPRGFVEFEGGGKLPSAATYNAGEAVVFLYQVRRNRSCSTAVLAQFWSYEKNGIVSEYSYPFTAVQAPITKTSALFSVRVKLPANMSEGNYSYAPILTPDPLRCPSSEIVQVPPSDFFKVAESDG